MTDPHATENLEPGSRMMLHGHPWRVVRILESRAHWPATVREPSARYDVVPPRAPTAPDTEPWCVVVGGPNGAGKTTFALDYLPQYADCHEFVNPDLIAAGLSPLSPQTAAVQAGRLVLERIRELAARHMSFGFETTLAGRGHLASLTNLRQAGYRICLILVWVPDLDLCTARIACRVRAGGHNVPETDVQRRFPRIVANLPHYRALADRFLVFDNTEQNPALVYEQSETGEVILDAERLCRIRLETGL